MRLLTLSLALSTLAPTAYADEYFRFTRVDSTIPENCQEFKVEFFPADYQTVIYGINGARERGFTHEYALDRDDATWLWESFKHSDIANRQGREGQRLVKEIDMIEAQKRPMGFDFGSEGEVLELLALNDIKREFPESEYFHTGGLEYHAAGSSTTIGELDILIARRSDCRIVTVGEAKLGVGMLGKAKQQLERFGHFITGVNRFNGSRLLVDLFR